MVDKFSQVYSQVLHVQVLLQRQKPCQNSQFLVKVQFCFEYANYHLVNVYYDFTHT